MNWNLTPIIQLEFSSNFCLRLIRVRPQLHIRCCKYKTRRWFRRVLKINLHQRIGYQIIDR